MRPIWPKLAGLAQFQTSFSFLVISLLLKDALLRTCFNFGSR